MIILPPEEKKSSPVMKWLFRILLACIVLIAAGLFVLKILSGTSDSHRRGLEQAFSELSGSTVKIGELTTFNIAPQFVLEMRDVRGENKNGLLDFRAEDLRVAFSFADILFKRPRIEDLQAHNLIIEAGFGAKQPLTIKSLTLMPAEKELPARFQFDGNYGAAPFNGFLEVARVPLMGRPSYSVAASSVLRIELGRLHLNGSLEQGKDGYPILKDTVIKSDERVLMTGEFSYKGLGETASLVANFTMGQSKGQFTFYPPRDEQNWVFETLDLNDVLGDDPIWSDIMTSLNQLAPATSTVTAEEKQSELVKVELKQVNGDIQFSRATGNFVFDEGRIAGWWQGDVSFPAFGKIPELSGQVTCGLLDMKSRADDWVSTLLIMNLADKSASGSLQFNEFSGAVKYVPGKIADTGSEPTPTYPQFTALRERLGITDTHACAGFVPAQEKP